MLVEKSPYHSKFTEVENKLWDCCVEFHNLVSEVKDDVWIKESLQNISEECQEAFYKLFSDYESMSGICELLHSLHRKMEDFTFKYKDLMYTGGEK